ncbi:DUF6087 family protein [Streptomyces odonnellii]|uniref:DUF6087 family protein n=1 Tax=Streptomyces odonnellii TaxID=1417980 RepID=UPI00099DB6AE|nr:DUF6087 family protein [Streptomyces odonnellii]
MGKHRRPGPPNQPPRAVPAVDPGDPVAAYEKRRRAPLDGPRRHRPVRGGARHLDPHAPRILEEWTGFAYAPVGTALGLAAAQAWVDEFDPGATEG